MRRRTDHRNGFVDLTEKKSEDYVNDENAEKSEACNAKTHYGTALESNLKSLSEVAGGSCAVGYANVCVGCDLHTDVACAFAHSCSEEQCYRCLPGNEEGNDEGHGKGNCNNDFHFVGKECVCSDSDSGGDLFHTVCAFVKFFDRKEINCGISEGKHSRTDRHKKNYGGHLCSPFNLIKYIISRAS